MLESYVVIDVVFLSMCAYLAFEQWYIDGPVVYTAMLLIVYVLCMLNIVSGFVFSPFVLTLLSNSGISMVLLISWLSKISTPSRPLKSMPSLAVMSTVFHFTLT